jgi:hypothetical protein
MVLAKFGSDLSVDELHDLCLGGATDQECTRAEFILKMLVWLDRVNLDVRHSFPSQAYVYASGLKNGELLESLNVDVPRPPSAPPLRMCRKQLDVLDHY